jgi:hypothetical protein
MRRVLLMFLSLVLALAGWSAVCAEDGFYVIPAMRGKYAPVPKTGQTITYAPGDDGALQKGVTSPTPRFTDNKNGTVTDNLTGLIWMKNASNIGADGFGVKTWADAVSAANGLHTGQYGLTDGSQVGDWRLPNARELHSLIDYGRYDPALPEGHPFTGMDTSVFYWSSTSHQESTYNAAYYMDLADGDLIGWDGLKSNSYYVWCVRGGK